MGKSTVIESLRRTLLICLWIIGGGVSLFLVGYSLFTSLILAGIIVSASDVPWWLMVVYFLGGVVTIGLTFLLHIAINWLFRKCWISDYKYGKESKPSWMDKTNRLVSEGMSTNLRKRTNSFFTRIKMIQLVYDLLFIPVISVMHRCEGMTHQNHTLF